MKNHLHSSKLDGIIALNEETVYIHRDNLKKDGFILCDSSLKGDFDAIRIPMADKAEGSLAIQGCRKHLYRGRTQALQR